MMFGLYVVSFEVLMIVIYAIFIRTEVSTFTNLELFNQSNILLLGFTLASLNFRNYDWTTISNLLLTSAVTFQWNSLFYIFWSSCFKRTFSSTSSITLQNFMSSTEAILCVLIITLPYLGRIEITQYFVITLVAVIGYSLNFAVQINGIKAVTGGGGISIFLFAAVFSLILKIFTFTTPKPKESTSYFSSTLKLIGLLIIVFSWPSFNTMGATFDADNVSSTANLGPSSFYNTLLCLCSAVISSLTLQSFGTKINMKKFIDSVINSGVFISASCGMIIDPFASILLGILGPLLTVLYQRYGQRVFFRNEPEYMLAFSFLSGLFSCIFAAGRAARSPTLTSEPYKLGGLQVASIVVTIGFAAVFGLLTMLILKIFKPLKDYEVGQDQTYWVVTNEMIPLYHGDQLANFASGKPEKRPGEESVELGLPGRNSGGSNSNGGLNKNQSSLIR